MFFVFKSMIKDTLIQIGASENSALKLLARFMRWPIRSAQLQLLRIHKAGDVINLVQAIQKDGGSLMWPTEMIQVYNCVSAVRKLNGDFAEVGVFLGRSAKVICEAKGDGFFYLFESFEGLPKPESVDSGSMHEKMYTTSLNLVKQYLAGYKNVIFYPGNFPETAEPVKSKLFAFVHLDVDLHQGTLDCLRFFYNRMVRGGIILSHDYSSLVGVKKAFDEFFIDKPESVIELSTSQCMIVRNFPPAE